MHFQRSIKIIAQGLSHFSGSMDLYICQGINHMNLNRFDEALSIFLEYQTHAHVIPYIIECYKQMGDFENAQIFSAKII